MTNAVVSNTTDGDFSTLGMNFPDLLAHVGAIDIAPPPAAGYNPLWTWTDGMSIVTFVLTSYAITQRTATNLDLNGTGYFTATGFAQTDGKWNLSAQLTTGQIQATYSASSVVPVPEPTSLAILGLGLLGAGVAARRKQRADA